MSESSTKNSIDLKKEFRERVTGYLLGAFGLVAGLAWNDAIQESIRVFFPLDNKGLLAKFFYAVVMTVVLVLLSTHIMRWAGGQDEK